MTDRGRTRETGRPRERGDAGTGERLRRRLPSLPWLARAAGTALSVVAVGFVLAFLFVVGRGGRLTLLTRPPAMRAVLALPSLVAFLGPSAALGAALAWRNGYWSRRARVHQTVLALLGLGLCWQLWVLGFLPP